jgi:pyridoxine 5-phosphate synthase
MRFARLGVNVDHVATLRQQRGEHYPDVVRAAEVCLATGAEQITIHLREDRRHIQDRDVPEVQQMCTKMGFALNLEMGATDEMIEIAVMQKPEWVCLVPEKRLERTTEGGLNVLDLNTYENLKKACIEIKRGSPKTKISLFVEANEKSIEKCLTLQADAVEIHTGEYARDFMDNKSLTPHLLKYQACSKIIKKENWGYHAGHGLTYESLIPLLEEGYFEEYNIGHWIISESIFIGLGHVTKEMVTLIKKYPLKG